MAKDIYEDIAARTGGDIYIGVVGPVRTGKSTFINRFMEQFVIPNIESDFRKERAIDELPQSSAGKTIMTTEPKFVPEEAVRITIDGGTSFNVRLIDCVGYIIPSALGYIENDAPRMVDTPWFEEPVPFNMAAEVGTEKVITQHSTIGLVVTTDGSITDLPRDEYEECEQRVISELRNIEKPFVVLMNTVRPQAKAVTGRSGMGKREPDDVGIHAIRMGNIVGVHEVMIGTQNERITLKHEAFSRGVFAEGSLKAAAFLTGKTPGIYDMKDLLKEG